MNQRQTVTLNCPQGDALLEGFLIASAVAHGSVIICPGGGYTFCSPREAEPVAHVWNRAGYHAFVLWYDCEAPMLGYAPVQQLAWAVSEVRQKSADWMLDASRIAVCGFSAGGHLAATLGTLWQDDTIFTGTYAAQRRPDALILGYPVITAGAQAHRDSLQRLAGTDCAAQQAFSLEKHVTAQTPPTFLWHTMDDATVPVQNTLLFSQALMHAGVRQEVHLFAHGVHGMSLATADTSDPTAGRYPDAHIATWFPLACTWLQTLFETPCNGGKDEE